MATYYCPNCHADMENAPGTCAHCGLFSAGVARSRFSPFRVAAVIWAAACSISAICFLVAYGVAFYSTDGHPPHGLLADVVEFDIVSLVIGWLPVLVGYARRR